MRVWPTRLCPPTCVTYCDETVETAAVDVGRRSVLLQHRLVHHTTLVGWVKGRGERGEGRGEREEGRGERGEESLNCTDGSSLQGLV